MIVNEKMYHVSAIDIANTAKRVALEKLLNGDDKEVAKKVLHIYAMVINEIPAYNNIPWESLAEWTACVNSLCSSHTVESILKEAEEIQKSEIGWQKTNKNE